MVVYNRCQSSNNTYRGDFRTHDLVGHIGGPLWIYIEVTLRFTVYHIVQTRPTYTHESLRSRCGYRLKDNTYKRVPSTHCCSNSHLVVLIIDPEIPSLYPTLLARFSHSPRVPQAPHPDLPLPCTPHNTHQRGTTLTMAPNVRITP